MIDHHSPIAHAAYHDLLRSLQDDMVSEIKGTPTRVDRNGRGYWYDSFRIGTEVKKRYIGEDTPELRTRIAQHQALRRQAAERSTARARLIRILRAEGFLGVDAGTGSLMAALAKAGVFRLGGTLIGTHAFRLYEGELGVRFRFDQAAQTDDLDIASFERLSLALDDTADPPVAAMLDGFDFAPVPSRDGDKVWRWQQTRNTLLVEFLTPSFDAEEGLRPLKALGVDAQSLHFLNYLIADPLKAAAVYRSGVLLQIPRPERFAIHKLIVADRRRGGPDSLKSRKDRLQAAFLIEVLAEDRPEDLKEAYADALSRGPKWRERLGRSIAKSTQIAAHLARL